jgi:hypothetical protein
MRDLAVNIFDRKSGLSSFAMKNISQATGINLLVAKVTKKILSSTFSTSLFTYYGLDLQNIPQYGIADNDISNINTFVSSSLQNILTSIQNNTSKTALSTEKLASLILFDLIYDKTNHQILLKITLTPVQGDSQTLLFPLGA